MSKLAKSSSIRTPTSGNESDDDALVALAALKKVKEMPAYVPMDPYDDPERQSINVRRLIVRMTTVKQSEIINFEAQLDGLHEKKTSIIE